MKKIIISFLAFSFSICAFALDGLMRDSTLVLKPNVKDFSDVAIRENVLDGRAVQYSPLDLKVGDIFIDVDGGAKKVVSVSKKGNKINIKTAKPDFKEVFEYICIPEQESDFSPVVNDYLDNRYGIQSSEDDFRAASDDSRATTSKMVLDEFMSKKDSSVKHFSFSLKTRDKLPTFSIEPPNPSDYVKEEDMQHMTDVEKEELDKLKEDFKKAKKLTTSLSLSIEPEIRYRSNSDTISSAFKYAEIGIDRRGTWKFWKWRKYYHPGYVKFNYIRDVETGIGISVKGGANSAYKIPIYPAVGTGPYVSFDMEFKFNLSANLVYQYYSRNSSYNNVEANINLLFIPSNLRTTSVTWNPTVQQLNVYANGQLSAGPVGKAGIKLLKLNVVEVSLGGGVSVSGMIGGQISSVDLDTANYDKLKDCLKGNYVDQWRVDKIINNYKTLEQFKKDTTGGRMLANFGIKAYLKLDLSLLDVFSTDLLSCSWSIFNLNGFSFSYSWESPFKPLFY